MLDVRPVAVGYRHGNEVRQHMQQSGLDFGLAVVRSAGRSRAGFERLFFRQARLTHAASHSCTTADGSASPMT
jgi:hypothetical protein